MGVLFYKDFAVIRGYTGFSTAIRKDPSAWKPFLWAAYFECRGALESRLRQEMAGGIVGFAGVRAMLTKFCGSPQSRRLEGEWRG